MDYEWGHFKRVKNLSKHRLDFYDAKLLFDERDIITAPSTQGAEKRYLTIGIIADVYVALIWTIREKRIRFISFRRARNEEKDKHIQTFEKERQKEILKKKWNLPLTRHA